jgi:hypothetical protein
MPIRILSCVNPYHDLLHNNALGLHNNARFSVSPLLNLDSAGLPGMVCVNPHHDFDLHNNARFPVSSLLDLDPA